MNTRAVFLDKDGTLIEDLPYNVVPEKIRLVSGAREALSRLQQAGYRLFIVTNQAGIALGLFPETALEPIAAYLDTLLGQIGIRLAGFYYCPHHPQGTVPTYTLPCTCRKPQPGLLLRAADEHGLDLSASWAIGDILHDVEAGRRAGCRTVLINNGHETEWDLSPQRLPHHLAADLDEAARIIVALTPPTSERTLKLVTLEGV